MATVTVQHCGDGGGGDSSSDPFASCLGVMTAALTQAVDAPAWSLTDEALVERITATVQVRAGVDELLARLVGSALERELARLAGASSPTAWLESSQQLSRGGAATVVAAARAVNDTVEATRTAWSQGRVNTDQAVLIASTVTSLGVGVDMVARADAESYLIDQAPHFTLDQFRRLANHLIEVVDPETADARLAALLAAEEARAWQATMFRGRAGADGIARFSGRIPNVSFAMLQKALEACAAPRRNPTNPPGTPLSDTVHGPGTSDVIDPDGAHSDTETGPLTYPQRLGRRSWNSSNTSPQTNFPNTALPTPPSWSLSTPLPWPPAAAKPPSTPAPLSPPPKPVGSLATRGSSPSCWTGRRRSSTSACPNGSSTATNASPSQPATKAACGLDVTGHPPGAKLTTSHPGRAAGLPI